MKTKVRENLRIISSFKTFFLSFSLIIDQDYRGGANCDSTDNGIPWCYVGNIAQGV